jgi:uncharacterized integral membrane protein
LFSTLGRLLKWLVLLPILAAILALAVANGQTVTVYLNPFDRTDAVLQFELPLYQLGFILFVLGALVGGLVAWSGQIRQRRRERARREAALFPGRAERPVKRQPAPAPAAGLLPRPADR